MYVYLCVYLFHFLEFKGHVIHQDHHAKRSDNPRAYAAYMKVGEIEAPAPLFDPNAALEEKSAEVTLSSSSSLSGITVLLRLF